MSNHSFEEEELDGYVKIDQYNQDKVDRIAAHYTDILESLGENPNRAVIYLGKRRVFFVIVFLLHQN